MHPLLNKNIFFLKQQTGQFSITQRFDVYDSETKEQLMKRQEPKFGTFKDMLRLIGYTASLPFHAIISDINGNRLFSVKRKFSFFGSKAEVFDENETLVGKIKKSPWYSFGSDFHIVNREGKRLCGFIKQPNGFSKGDTEFARLHGNIKNLRAQLIDVTDQYELKFNADVTPSDDPLRILIFGAIMSIDLLIQSKPKKKILKGGLFDI